MTSNCEELYPPTKTLEESLTSRRTPPPFELSQTPQIMSLIPPVMINIPVGPHSVEVTCPQCRCRIKTKVTHRSTTKTHIACLLLSWTCCCCCLPYCMDSCRNANHFCPMCGTFIGTYQS